MIQSPVDSSGDPVTGPPSYVLLIAPSANRVYADASVRLSQAELVAFGRLLSTPPRDVAEVPLGGVRYVGFSTEKPLTERDLGYLSNLSSAYALFARVGEELLAPVALHPLARYDDDLITIPKYAGKTNEQYTKLLLNLTLLASTSGPGMLEKRLTVLDPLCGRGTTLNQALMYGYNAIGIERDGKDVDAYSAFLRTWLRRKQLKHQSDTHPVRKDRRTVARRFETTIGGRHEDGQWVAVFHADTMDAREFLKGQCADVVVADAPYGVAHASHSAAGGRARDPLALLREAVPVWVRLLRPGGALGISWNTMIAKRADAAAVLTEAGLTVVEEPGYLDIEHRVDQAINRDVLVARR